MDSDVIKKEEIAASLPEFPISDLTGKTMHWAVSIYSRPSRQPGQCTQSKQYTVYNALCALYTVQNDKTMHREHTIYNAPCTLYTVQKDAHNIHGAHNHRARTMNWVVGGSLDDEQGA